MIQTLLVVVFVVVLQSLPPGIFDPPVPIRGSPALTSPQIVGPGGVPDGLEIVK